MMRKVLATVQMNGVVVIGEGEKDVRAHTSSIVLPCRSALLLLCPPELCWHAEDRIASGDRCHRSEGPPSLGLNGMLSSIICSSAVMELNGVALLCRSSVYLCCAGSSYAVLWRRNWHRR